MACNSVQVFVCSSLQIPCKHGSQGSGHVEKCYSSAELARSIPGSDDVDDPCKGSALEQTNQESHCIHGVDALCPGTAKRRQAPEDLESRKDQTGSISSEKVAGRDHGDTVGCPKDNVDVVDVIAGEMKVFFHSPGAQSQ